MANARPEQPETGWAVRTSPDEVRRSQDRSERLRKLATERNLLILVLAVWNAYFLMALAYTLAEHSPDGNNVLSIEVWLWIFGDLAILAIAWAISRILRARRRRT